MHAYGRRSRNDDIKWSRLPLSFGRLPRAPEPWSCFLLHASDPVTLTLHLIDPCSPHLSLQRTLPVCDLLQLAGRDRDPGARCSRVRRVTVACCLGRGMTSTEPDTCVDRGALTAAFSFSSAHQIPTLSHSLSLLSPYHPPDPTRTPTWTSPTRATWARPSRRGPSTWPPPTRTS